MQFRYLDEAQARFGSSLLQMAAAMRCALACVVVAALWAAVGWALAWW